MTQTGTATAARTLSAPVRVVRELGVDRLEVVTLPGGRGGWATPGKTLVIGRAIFTPDA